MAFYYEQDVRPLHSLTDVELLQIVDLYATGVFEVNSRKMVLVETMYSENPDESTICFRITSEDIDNPNRGKLISGFLIQFDDNQLDLYFMPLNKMVMEEEWLIKNGITEEFSSHRLGIKSVHKLFNDTLKMWARTPLHPLHNYSNGEQKQWRKVQGLEV